MASSKSITLADKIKELRAEKPHRHQELGRMVEVFGMHISNLEKGQVGTIARAGAQTRSRARDRYRRASASQTWSTPKRST